MDPRACRGAAGAALGLLLLSTAPGCRDRPAPFAPPPPSASARDLRIDSAPGGAEATVEGQRCVTPCAVRVEPGRHRVALRKAGYLPFDADVEVGATGEARVSAELVASH